MTAATTFQTGDVVPNYVGLPITITGVRADGIYESAYGGEWVAVADDGEMFLYPYDAPSVNGNGSARPAADVRPVANETGLTFQVDVSRTYRNKDGYEVSGLKLNSSFVTETHTVESFIETVVKEGWPYTMVHAKRSPQETGAAARGVLTPKHTENFTSSQLLTFDDDSRLPGVVDFWTHEPFFGRYGLAFVESVNSEPGIEEKGHPTLLLDGPITDPELYRECFKAFYFAHPQLDRLTNIDRTIYNAQGARVHMVGAVCPFEEFERTYLEPYRAAEREKSAAIEAERERRRQEAERAKAEGRTVSHSLEEAYLAGYLRWLFDHVAAKRAGDNRNKATYWAGRCIAGIEATEWARPYDHLLADVETRIVAASAANGYLSEYAQDDEREVLRVFDLGRRAGGEPLDAPTPRASVNGRGQATSGADGGHLHGTTPKGDAVQPGAAVAASPVAFKLDDTGNAERFVTQHGDDVRYDHSTRHWYIWAGTHWRRDDDGAIQRRAKTTARAIYDEAATAAQAGNDDLAAQLAKWARASAAESRRNAMLNLARAELPIAITHDLFNRHDLLLNCANGTLDLATGQLQPHDRGDLLTYVLPVAFDPAAVCPTWDTFIDRVTGGNKDLAGFSARAVGYTLSGLTTEQCLFFLHGGGANGKSTLVETVMALMGDLGHKARAQVLMLAERDRVSNEVAALAGRRLVVTSELSDGGRLDEGLVKDLTGGDSMSARFLYGEPFTFKPTFTLWLYGNHKPTIKGTDDGIWRRVRLVPFTVQIPEGERDATLPAKLRAELPGILAWAVRGWQDFQRHGLGTPAAVTEATAEYRAESDTLGQFLADCCILTEGATARGGELYAAYTTWAEQNGLRYPLNNARFGRALRGRGYTSDRDNRGNFWLGVGLLAAD